METTRRSFYHRIICSLWATITAAVIVPTWVYLFRPSHKAGSVWVDAGDVRALEAGKPKEVVFLRLRVDGWKRTSGNGTAWLVKSQGEKITAFAPQCTHLGCPYHWDEKQQKFVCPCHDSLFSISGEVLTGPAPRTLDRYEVRLEGSRVWLGPVVRSEKISA